MEREVDGLAWCLSSFFRRLLLAVYMVGLAWLVFRSWAYIWCGCGWLDGDLYLVALGVSFV